MEGFANLIKPCLEKFLKEPTKQNTKELTRTIQNSDWNKIGSLETYILAPLILKLDKLSEDKSSDLKSDLVDCVKTVISKSRIKNVNQLKTTLTILLKQIHDFSTGYLNKNLSEEIKLSVLSCVSELFQRTTTDVLQLFYDKSNCNLVGKIAVTCVDVIENEKYKTLRICAIQCLLSVFYVHDAADQHDVVLRHQVAETTFMFLPKVVAVHTKIALNDHKIGDSLIALAVTSLGRILHLIYEDNVEVEGNQYSNSNFLNLLSEGKDTDKIEKDTDEAVLGSNIKNKPIEEKIKIIQDLSRNEKWFKATSNILRHVFTSLQMLQSNQSDTIRKEYAVFVTTLLGSCSSNLFENSNNFLESTIALSQDDNVEIKTLCDVCLSELKRKRKIAIEWEDLFSQHMIKLPRIIHRNDDTEQISEFLFLKGFVQHIPDANLCTIFSFQMNLDRFANNFMEALSLKFSNDILNEEYATISELKISEGVEQFQGWKKYNHISARTAGYIETILAKLGSSTARLIIFNHLLEFANKNLHLSNEALLILTFMSNDAETLDQTSSKLIELFLTELSDEKHWHLALFPELNDSKQQYSSWYVDQTPGLYESGYETRTIDMPYDQASSTKQNINRIDAQFNVLHTCTVLYAIGKCSSVIGNDFQRFVFKFLHRVLLKTNCSNALVQRAAFLSLTNISTALGYSTVSDLIQNYSDYLTYHINTSLKRAGNSDSGVDMLSVVLQYSSIESFSHLENILESLLQELAKYSHSSDVLSYLKVFNVFLVNLSRWIQSLHDDINTNVVKENENGEQLDLLTLLKNALESSEEMLEEAAASNSEQQTDQVVPPDPEQADKSDEGANQPKYISLTVGILTKVLKFIPAKEHLQSIVALECFIVGLPILKDYEDQLLPLVHLLWYPYVERFKEPTPIVLNRCFSLLEVLADCSKNFLQKRILKEIIPLLNQFLQAAWKNSLKNVNLTSTQEHKLQVKLLSSYARIAIDMDIQSDRLESMTNIVISYLDMNQPKSLQDAAILYFLVLSESNKPFVYMKLRHYHSDPRLRENVQVLCNRLKFGI